MLMSNSVLQLIIEAIKRVHIQLSYIKSYLLVQKSMFSCIYYQFRICKPDQKCIKVENEI